MAIEQKLTLSSGRDVTVRMPDLYAILATVGNVPSTQMIDLLNLLNDEGALSLNSAPQPTDFVAIRNRIRGKYALIAEMLAEPRLVLNRAPQQGEIAPDDLNYSDIEMLWYWFQYCRAETPADVAESGELERAESAARDGRDIQAAPKPNSRGKRSARGVGI